MCDNLRKKGRGTNKHLCDELLKANLKKIYASLMGTVAEPLVSPDATKMAQSIRAVLNANAEAIRFLPDGGEQFSIKDWIKRDNGEASILFITAQYAHLDMSRSLLTLWMNIAINTIMTLKHTRQLRTWFIFDELAALHQLPALERGLQTARSFGGAFLLGLHNFAGLRKTYPTRLRCSWPDRATESLCRDRFRKFVRRRGASGLNRADGSRHAFR